MCRLKSSPLLLAASSGSLASLKMLMKFNAFIARRDDEGHTIIHLAALRFHTNIINYFIEIKHQDVPVWHMLVGGWKVSVWHMLVGGWKVSV